MVINLTTYGSSPIETVPHPRLYSQDQETESRTLPAELHIMTSQIVDDSAAKCVSRTWFRLGRRAL